MHRQFAENLRVAAALNAWRNAGGDRPPVCPTCRGQFGDKMPGHLYGSNWDWVPCPDKWHER